MTFPAYPEYKDSGVEWIGKIPAHWKIIPLSKMATSSGGLFIDGDWIESKDLSSTGIRYLTSGNVGAGAYKEQGLGYISEEKFAELRCVEVFPNDILISRLNLPIGRSCLVPDLGERIVTCVDNVICRPSVEYDRRFWVYLLSSEQHFANMELQGRGATMQRISRSILGNVRFPVPSVDEQKTIANFLDHEIAKIDALITEQEKLIELLTEKRQSVISNAVCRGLDPNVPMKDSGVDWLGMVPEHWVVSKTVRYFKVAMGQTILKEDLEDDGVYPVFSATEGSHYFGRINNPTIVLNVGDLVIPARGNSIGFVKRVFEASTTSQTTIYCKNLSSEKVKHDFVFYYMLGFKSNLFYFTQTAIPQITVEEVGGNPILLPPASEQTAIAKFLDYETAKIDELKSEAVKATQILQERRSALISAAVTGQIDVRNFQSKAS